MLDKKLTQNLKTIIFETFHEVLENDSVIYISNLLSKYKEQSELQRLLSFSLIRRNVKQTKIQIEFPIADRKVLVKWTHLDLARCYYLIQLFDKAPTQFLCFLKKLVDFADLKEKESLYKIFFFLPNSNEYVDMMIEGVRTNATSVFKSIAFNNPYAFFHLDESAWNQMVLKALFLDQPINEIYGISERSNPNLVRMIQDFLQERTVANRPISSQVMQFLEENDPNFYGMRSNLFIPKNSPPPERRL